MNVDRLEHTEERYKLLQSDFNNAGRKTCRKMDRFASAPLPNEQKQGWEKKNEKNMISLMGKKQYRYHLQPTGFGLISRYINIEVCVLENRVQ